MEKGMQVTLSDVYVNSIPQSSSELGRFGFNFMIVLEDGTAIKDNYESSHSWENLDEFESLVKNGYGQYLAFERYIENLNWEDEPLEKNK